MSTSIRSTRRALLDALEQRDAARELRRQARIHERRARDIEDNVRDVQRAERQRGKGRAA